MTFAASGADGWLPNHPKSGEWYSLKGRMLSPYEMAPLESTNQMNPRPQAQSSMTGKWDSDVVVSTPLTGGGGTMAH